MTKTIKGFFFDLDGTLVDTHESNFRAYRQAVDFVLGISLGDELKSHIKNGESSNSFLPALVPEVTESQVRAINSKKKELYPHHLNASKLNQYLSTFLAQMSEHYTTALVTTAKKENAQAVLEVHDLSRLFSFMIYGEDVKSMKPSPEAYELALERAGLVADEVVAFEDSENGIEAAHGAGIMTIHIRNFL